MPFVTGWERHGMLQVIERSLRAKFGEAGAALVPEIEALGDADKYLTIQDVIMQANDLDDIRRACADAAAPAPRGRKAGNGKRGRPKP